MAYRDVILADSPIEYWEFNEASGSTLDSVGSGNHDASATGTTVISAGKVGNAREFDGVDDTVTAANVSDFMALTSYTIECWVRYNNVSGMDYPTFFRRDGNGKTFLVRTRANAVGRANIIEAYVSGRTVDTGTTTFNDGLWHHVVVTKSGTTVRLFIDGVEYTTANGTVSTGGTGTAATTYIGRGTGSTEFFKGGMDEVAIYGTALTPTQIANHYSAAQSQSVAIDETTATVNVAGINESFAGHPSVAVDLETAGVSLSEPYATIEAYGTNAITTTIVPVDDVTRNTSDTLSISGTGTNLWVTEQEGYQAKLTFSKSALLGTDPTVLSSAILRLRVSARSAPANGDITVLVNGTNPKTFNGSYTTVGSIAEWDVTSLIEASGETINLYLKDDGGAGSAYVHFSSVDSVEPTYRPTLTALYEEQQVPVDMTLPTATMTSAAHEATAEAKRNVDLALATATISVLSLDAIVGEGEVVDVASAAVSLASAEATVETVYDPNQYLDMDTVGISVASGSDPLVGIGTSVDADDTDTVMLGAYDPTLEMTSGVFVDLDTPRTFISRIPLTDVNGTPIVPSETEDRYFVATMNTLVGVQRGFSGGSSIDDKDTPVEPYRQTWFRMNETSGNVAYDRLKAENVAKENQPQLLLSNVTVGQKNGPEGRHHFTLNGDAYMKSYIEEGAVKESGIEFTFRTTKQTQFLMGNADEYGNLSTQQGDEWELWINNGKLEIRRWPFVNTYGGAFRTPKEVITGNKFVSDGEWHHVVLQSGYATWLLNNINRNHADYWGMELHIDGNLDIRRRAPSIAVAGFPDFIGGRPTPFYDNVRASEDVPVSQWFEGDLTEIVYRSGRILSPDEIALQRDTMMGVFPYYGEAPKVTLEAEEAITKGNKPRMLVLHFGAPPDVKERMVDFTVEPIGLNLYDTYAETLRGKPSTVPMVFVGLGENTTHYNMADKTAWPDVDYLKFHEWVAAPHGHRTYRTDAVTDNYRLLDLDLDLNMDDYDVISIAGFPGDESQMTHYNVIDANNVEPMIPARKQLETLLGQIKDQVRFHGKGLFIADPFSATMMGIIDQVDVVPEYFEFAPAGVQNIQIGGVYPGFDGHAYATDPFGGARPQSRLDENGIPRTDWEAYDDREKTAGARLKAAARYTDTHSNVYQTVRSIVEGLTTYPGHVIADEIHWWNVNPFNEPPYHFSIRFEDKRAGLKVGDTFVIDSPFYDEDTLGTFEDDLTRKHLLFRVAAPMSSVKAGRAITSFSRTLRLGLNEAMLRNEGYNGDLGNNRPNDIVGNPFGDHAIAIAIQPGDIWDGAPVSGKVYVNFTESNQMFAERVHHQPRMAWEHLDGDEYADRYTLAIGEEFTFADGAGFQITPEMARFQFSTHYGSNAGSEIPLPPGSNPDWGWSAGGTRGSGMSGGGAYAMSWNWKPAAELISLAVPTMSNRALKWLATDLDMDGEVRVNTETVKVTAKANDVTVETTADVAIDLSTARVTTESYVDKDTIAADTTALVGTAAVTLKAVGLVTVVDMDTPRIDVQARELENTVLDELDWSETILLTMPRQIITLTLEEN